MDLLPQLNLVIALPDEAKPLIDYYQLRKDIMEHNFPIFTSMDRKIHLIIAGVGKTKIAAAVAYLYYYVGRQNYCYWANIGIAGHQTFKIGHIALANKISDHETQKHFYPKKIVHDNFDYHELLTVAKPLEYYPAAVMIDMEGAAFFEAANLFVTQEQIQVIKIISDNAENSAANINKNLAQELIIQQIPVLHGLLQNMQDLALQEHKLQLPPKSLVDMQQKWRFSFQEQRLLQEYLRRFEIMCPQEDPRELCGNLQSTREVIQCLVNCLEAI